LFGATTSSVTELVDYLGKRNIGIFSADITVGSKTGAPV
jgi:hypothetical protein